MEETNLEDEKSKTIAVKPSAKMWGGIRVGRSGPAQKEL